jgi:uncharacterized membrane protein (UPF0127 family)
MKRTLLSIAFALALAAPAFAQPAGTATITSGDKTHAVKITLADTPDAIVKGLRDRTSLPADEGVLLDLRKAPEGLSINMKGVAFDTDFLFLGPDGGIVAIASNARAGSLRPVAPGLRAAAILEIPAGRAAALGVKPGDKVRHGIFGNAG